MSAGWSESPHETTMTTPLPTRKTSGLAPCDFARDCAPNLPREKLHMTTAPAAARVVATPQWEMPKIRHMGLKADPFADADWRLKTTLGE